MAGEARTGARTQRPGEGAILLPVRDTSQPGIGRHSQAAQLTFIILTTCKHTLMTSSLSPSWTPLTGESVILAEIKFLWAH